MFFGWSYIIIRLVEGSIDDYIFEVIMVVKCFVYYLVIKIVKYY